ncbi:nitroreductase family protein [Mycoplasma sp. P36-A1]|uniref:nitroreductase family protein n=1 Tax=Mycoplasma sp. P36-A1 TaxID=3252900 RepID=UPI003C301989
MLNNYLEDLKNLRSRREMIPESVVLEDLEKAIECARYAASAVNAQKLRFALVTDLDSVDTMFNATNLPTKHNIPQEKACGGFIVIGLEQDIPVDFLTGVNCGISVQIIREALQKLGYASLDIHSFDRIIFKEKIGVDNFYPINIIAVGKSNQEVNIEDTNNDVTNYTNDQGIHTVRKLTTDKLIIKKL